MKTYNCKHCGIESKCGRSKTNTFCSNKCQREHQLIHETIPRFERGELTERSTIRRCLSHLRGYRCVVCGISEYNGMPITLQVDHIDGNPGNHFPSNVRLICPNCHSQTDTYSGANKGSGRKHRGLPLN